MSTNIILFFLYKDKKQRNILILIKNPRQGLPRVKTKLHYELQMYKKTRYNLHRAKLIQIYEKITHFKYNTFLYFNRCFVIIFD